jgi:hypothetical protein
MIRSSAVAMRLVRADTLEEVAAFPPGLPATFSRDGSRFVSIGANQRVHVWDIAAIRQRLRGMKLDWEDDTAVTTSRWPTSERSIIVAEVVMDGTQASGAARP